MPARGVATSFDVGLTVMEHEPADADPAAASRVAEWSDLALPTWVPGTVVSSVANALARLPLDEPVVLGVTSACRGEGRTTTAMAAAIAERYDHGRKTVLVDLDLHRPRVSTCVDAPPGPGLAEFLRGSAELAQCIRWYHQFLGVLSAGDVGPDADMLTSAALRTRVLDEVALRVDAVVADLPPLPPHGPGARLAAACGTVLLVVRAGATTHEDVRRAVRSLPRPPAVILNRVDPATRRRSTTRSS